MRRTNLFCSLKRGGLGLVNLEIKMKVQRFLYFRDNSDPFLRSGLQALGGDHLSRWTVLAGCYLGKKHVRAFYREVAAAARFFEQRFSWEYLCTVKKKNLYWDTIETVLPDPLYRHPGLSPLAENVLRRLRRFPVPTGTKDMFIRFHCEVLPVKVWLRKKGFFVPWSLNCDLCGAEETLFHVFVTCKRARDFWDDFRLHTKLDVNIDWMSLKYLVFDAYSENDAAATLVVSGLHGIWRFRMAIADCKVNPKTPWNCFMGTLAWIEATLVARTDAADTLTYALKLIFETMKKEKTTPRKAE
ncbi:uncharacterized protein LOC135376089 [Ornithodoros turicata]|uniref:uncharacterized protein LOC135376089 n=1 Tax=Ornithodoros turicata TaxID=34597 RepID=UPI003139CC7F